METKDQIVLIGDKLLREKGYNAFSYKDISNEIGIKTASIHYHFPAKSDLGIAIIQQHINRIKEILEKQGQTSAEKKLKMICRYYMQLMEDNQVCLVGAIATDFNTMEEPMKEQINVFCNLLLGYTTSILEQGIKDNEFKKIEKPKNKASHILASLMGFVQLARMHPKKELQKAIEEIITELKK